LPWSGIFRKNKQKQAVTKWFRGKIPHKNTLKMKDEKPFSRCFLCGFVTVLLCDLLLQIRFATDRHDYEHHNQKKSDF